MEERCPPAEPPVAATKSGIATELGDVLADPVQRALQIDEMVGKGRPRAEPVVCRDTHPAPSGQVIHQRQRLLPLVPDHPAAAVDLEQHRRVADAQHAVRRRPAVARPPSGSVRDVRASPAPPGRENRKGISCRRGGSGAASALRSRAESRLDVVGAQRGRECRLDHRLGPPRDRHQRQQPEPGREGDAEPDPAGPGVEARRPRRRRRVATTCQAKWCADSSEVSQPAKKLGTTSGPVRRCGT